MIISAIKSGCLRVFHLLATAIALSGCDTGRVGMHRVTFAPPAITGTASQSNDDEKLKQLVRDALAGKDFEEKPGTPHIWRKRGATVQVYRDDKGDLILRVGAFGGKRDVRVSDRAEQELLAILKKHVGLELTSVIPPPPTLK
jgi:hypothetical protein